MSGGQQQWFDQIVAVAEDAATVVAFTASWTDSPTLLWIKIILFSWKKW